MKGRTGTSRAAGRAPVLRAGAPDGARSKEPRSAKKRRAIVEAARALFLRNGYLATSMDEIAAGAGVSKQTVYSHFADKEGLFTQIVTAAVKEAADAVHAETLKLKESGDLHADLRKLARRQLALVMKPHKPSLSRKGVATGATAVGASATGTSALGSVALGAMALGAFAMGALAVGALAIGRLRIGKARIRKLRIDELEVGRIVQIGDKPE